MKSSDKAEKEFIDHMEYVFLAPIIQHPMWPVPDKIKDEALLYRLAETETISQQKATGFEVMGYLSSQSLVAPLDYHWYKTYMHLFRRYFKDQAESVLEGENVELGIMEQQMLERIQRWMFKQQVKHIREKSKGKRVDKCTMDVQQSLEAFV